MTRAPLSYAADEALAAILARDTQLLELGAGSGFWARALRTCGADVVALDPAPRGSGVAPGSHLDATDHPGRSLLICWPPDGTQVETWITAAHPFLFLVGAHARFFYAASQPPEQVIKLPWGRKGSNELRIYQSPEIRSPFCSASENGARTSPKN